jgi:hypothetical protein
MDQGQEPGRTSRDKDYGVVSQMPHRIGANKVRLALWRRHLVRHFAKNNRPVTLDSIVSVMPAIRHILAPEEATRIADEVAALRGESGK